jgi:hypothetical protein
MALALTNLGVSANPDTADTTNVLAYSNASWTPPYVINVPTIAPTFLISRGCSRATTTHLRGENWLI